MKCKIRRESRFVVHLFLRDTVAWRLGLRTAKALLTQGRERSSSPFRDFRVFSRRHMARADAARRGDVLGNHGGSIARSGLSLARPRCQPRECTHTVDLVARPLQRMRVWDTSPFADVLFGLLRKYSQQPRNSPTYSTLTWISS
jgi:hypothetical protein